MQTLFARLPLFLFLALGFTAGCDQKPAGRFAVGEILIEVPRDPSFELIRLDIGGQQGRVRIFGDGRYLLWSSRRSQSETVEDVFDGRLTEPELDALLQEAIGNGIVPTGFESQELRWQGPTISHPTWYRLTLQIAGGQIGDRRIPRPVRYTTLANDVFYKTDRLSSRVRAIGDLTRRLLELEAHPSSKPRPQPSESAANPPWLPGQTERPSQLAFHRNARLPHRRGSKRSIFLVDLRNLSYSPWLEVDSEHCSGTGGLRVSPELRGGVCRGIGGLRLFTGENAQDGRLLIDGYSDSHSLVWSGDGNQWAATVKAGPNSWDSLIFNRHGQELERHPKKRIRTWSPDQEFLYSDNQVMSRKHKGWRNIFSLEDVSTFSISPDGRYFAARASKREGIGKRKRRWLWLIPRDASWGGQLRTPKSIPIARLCGGFDWSPTSQKLIFVDCDLGLSLFHLETKQVHQALTLRPGARIPRLPNWSPDGKTIAFESRASHHWNQRLSSEVWLMGADGRAPRRIAGGHDPIWLEEGSRPVENL